MGAAMGAYVAIVVWLGRISAEWEWWGNLALVFLAGFGIGVLRLLDFHLAARHARSFEER
jgi:hypothetical protein